MSEMIKTSIELDFASAFEHAAIGLGLASLDAKWIMVNQSLCEMLGYSQEQLLSKSVQEITHADELATDDEFRRGLLKNERQSFHREKKYLHKDGRVIWAHLSVTLLRDKENNPLYYIAQIQNITDRRMAEKELRESRDNFRVLSEAMPQLVWMTSPDGRAVYFNQQWTDYTGMSVEQSLGENWTQCFHPDDRKFTLDAWTSAVKNAGDYAIEARLKKHGGDYQWWLIRGVPVRNDAQEITKWVGTCTDIDGLKTALEKAQIREEMIAAQSALINQARDAILLIDLDGRVQIWNEGATRLYGWTSAEAVGRTVTDLYARDTENRRESLKLLLLHGHWEGEFKQHNSSGEEIEVESRITLMKDSEGKPKSLLVINTDITAKKKNQEQIFRSQRLESIGTLAGGIAHDLNNVLAPIIMAVELLKMGETDRERLATLETIEACSQRGAGMVRQVLSFARGIDGERLELQPKNLLREIEKITVDTFLKSIQIECTVPSNLWTILGDVTQLHQVLLNLCINARDAMPSGGVLKISGENITLDELVGPAGTAGVSGDYVLLSVEDTGMGMSKDVLERVFEPFFTTKELGRGTGLGLSTSLAIVKSHKGLLRIYSEQGTGTRVKVYLPAKGINGAAGKKSASLDALPRGLGEWVLVVDDEPAVRSMTGQTLEKFGYRVKLASGGAEAVEIYTSHKDDIAVVVTDIMMPEIDGIATIKELKKIKSEVGTIAVSGLSSHAGTAIADRFLAKPYTAEALLKAIRDLLDGPRKKKA